MVLFDEIEKAYPRIWDKFLQVLDDGRLTDGKGRTVYFSEAILIFTSNLGTARLGPELQSLGYQDLCDHFRNSVRDFFVKDLGRPEILNRLGEDNILVFKFMQDEKAQNEIIEKQIGQLAKEIQDRFQVRIDCTDYFKSMLKAHPRGFRNNGARGVNNLLSKYLLNPLATKIFLNREQCEGKTFVVDYHFEEKKDQIAAPDWQFDKRRLDTHWE